MGMLAKKPGRMRPEPEHKQSRERAKSFLRPCSRVSRDNLWNFGFNGGQGTKINAVALGCDAQLDKVAL